MPMGIVSEEDFLQELARGPNFQNISSASIPMEDVGNLVSFPDLEAVHKDIKRGRGSISEVPPVIRAIAAEAAISGVPSKHIQEELGVSASSISAYKKDATSTASYNTPDAHLSKANDQVRNRILGSARSRLLQALDHITPEKLADAKLKDAASVARDMSVIIRNTEPQQMGPLAGAQFVFHVPKQRKESDFEVIDVTS